jgi:hypothetical protein
MAGISGGLRFVSGEMDRWFRSGSTGLQTPGVARIAATRKESKTEQAEVC